MQGLQDLYDIYDFWYVPWWATTWGRVIVAVAAALFLCLLALLGWYSVIYYRRRRLSEWAQIKKYLAELSRKKENTPQEYEQLVTIVKKLFTYRFGAAVQSKTDTELVVWLQSFPADSSEYQFISFFNTGDIRFTPGVREIPLIADYAKKALAYADEKKINP